MPSTHGISFWLKRWAAAVGKHGVLLDTCSNYATEAFEGGYLLLYKLNGWKE